MIATKKKRKEKKKRKKKKKKERGKQSLGYSLRAGIIL